MFCCKRSMKASRLGKPVRASWWAMKVICRSDSCSWATKALKLSTISPTSSERVTGNGASAMSPRAMAIMRWEDWRSGLKAQPKTTTSSTINIKPDATLPCTTAPRSLRAGLSASSDGMRATSTQFAVGTLANAAKFSTPNAFIVKPAPRQPVMARSCSRLMPGLGVGLRRKSGSVAVTMISSRGENNKKLPVSPIRCFSMESRKPGILRAVTPINTAKVWPCVSLTGTDIFTTA